MVPQAPAVQLRGPNQRGPGGKLGAGLNKGQGVPPFWPCVPLRSDGTARTRTCRGAPSRPAALASAKPAGPWSPATVRSRSSSRSNLGECGEDAEEEVAGRRSRGALAGERSATVPGDWEPSAFGNAGAGDRHVSQTTVCDVRAPTPRGQPWEFRPGGVPTSQSPPPSVSGCSTRTPSHRSLHRRPSSRRAKRARPANHLAALARRPEPLPRLPWPRRRRVEGRSLARPEDGSWRTHGLPPVGVAGPGITLIARCLRRSGVDAVPATGAGERVDERPVGRGRSPATFAAQHLGSTCWPSSVSQRRGRAAKGCSSSRRSVVAGVHEEGSLEFRPGGCLRRAPQRPRAPRDGVGVRRTPTPCLLAS